MGTTNHFSKHPEFVVEYLGAGRRDHQPGLDLLALFKKALPPWLSNDALNALSLDSQQHF